MLLRSSWSSFPFRPDQRSFDPEPKLLPHPAVTPVLAQVPDQDGTPWSSSQRPQRQDGLQPFDLKSTEMTKELRLFGVTLFFSAETSQDESALIRLMERPLSHQQCLNLYFFS